MKIIRFFLKIAVLAALFLPFSASAQLIVPITYGQFLTEPLPTTSSTVTFTTPVVQPGDVLFFKVGESGLQFRLELLSPSGTVLQSIPGAFNASLQIIYTIPAAGPSGNYKFLVSNTGIWTGQFCAGFDRMNASPAAKLLPCNTSLTDTLACGASIQSLRYTVKANSRSRIRISPMLSIAPEAWVCDQNGLVLRHGTASYTQAIEFDTILAATTACYYVYVTDAGGNWHDDFSVTHTLLSGECAAGSLSSSSPGGNICLGESFTLTAASPLPNAAFAWAGPNGFTSNQASVSFSNASLDLSGNYTVSITAPGVCASVFSQKITVNQPPAVTANITNDTGQICIGDYFRLNAVVTPSAGTYTYLWTGPNGFSAAYNQPGIYVTNAQDTSKSGTYKVVVADNKGCTASTQIDVQVNSLPKAEIKINLPLPGSVACVGQPLQLAAKTDISNAYFKWTGPAGFATNLQNPLIPIAAQLHEGSYKLTVTNTATGCTMSTSRTIYVNDPPLVTLSGFNPVCLGDSTQLIAYSSASNYLWSTGSTQQYTWVKPLTASVYTVTVTDNYGCIKSASDTVEVKALPVIGITSLPTVAEICVGSGSILLCAALDNVQSPGVVWKGPNGFYSNLPCNSFAQPSQSGIYSLTVKDGVSQCSNTVNKAVAIHALPSGSILQDPAAPTYFCEGKAFNLIANYLGTGLVYQWTLPDGTVSNQQILQTPYAQIDDGGNYALLVTDIYGCQSASNKVVDVFPKPEAAISGDLSICEGSGTALTASGGGTYQWSTGATSTLIQVDPLTTTTYFLIATSEKGCQDTAEATVTVAPNTLTLEVNTYNDDIVANASAGTPPYTYSIVPPVPEQGPNGSGNFINVSDGTYTVYVSDDAGCVSQHPVTVTIIPTLEPGGDLGLSVFPNPGRGLFTLRLDAGADKPLDLLLFDEQGRCMRRLAGRSPELTLDLSDLPAGIYMLRVADREKAGMVRLAVLRTP